MNEGFTLELMELHLVSKKFTSTQLVTWRQKPRADTFIVCKIAAEKLAQESLSFFLSLGHVPLSPTETSGVRASSI